MEAKDNLLHLPVKIIQVKTKRTYIYDYYAFVINSKGERDPYGKGTGGSTNQKVAKRRAIAEALERYCGSYINQEIILKSYGEVEKNAIDPKRLIFFDDAQYSSKYLYKRFDPSIPIEWVEGLSLVEKRKILVPAFSVYLGYNRFVSKSERFMPTSSSGLAVQTALEKSTIGSIFELIERDSAMITWLTRRKTLRIDLKSAQLSQLSFLYEKIRAEGLSAEVVVCTLDVPIPSVIAIVYDPKGGIPHASFGIATEVSIERAALKSLEEALLIRNILELFKIRHELRPISKVAVNNFIDHAIYYSFPQRQKYWDFLIKGPIMSVREVVKSYGFAKSGEYLSLDKLVGFFKKQKKEIIRVDLSTDSVKKMGYFVTKVIMPELQPMDITFNARFLKSTRLCTCQITNHYPHVFA